MILDYYRNKKYVMSLPIAYFSSTTTCYSVVRRARLHGLTIKFRI